MGLATGGDKHRAGFFLCPLLVRISQTGRVVYWGFNRIGDGPPLAFLDWDITQIEGSLLETWLPVVFRNCEALAKECRSRGGFPRKLMALSCLERGERRRTTVPFSQRKSTPKP